MDYGKGNDRAVIVCAACKKDDITLAGARHWDSIMGSQYDALPESKPKAVKFEQGFIDQFGNFYDREEAFAHCVRVGQEIDLDRNGGVGALFSEGLY